MIATRDAARLVVPLRDSFGETCLRWPLPRTGCSEANIQTFIDHANSPRTRHSA